MNQLSQILYWADVLPTFASWMLFIMFWVMIALALAFVFNRIALATLETDDEAPAIYRGTAFSRWLLPIIVVIWFSMWLVPSKETFYAIAASEMGEQALKSPIMTKAGKALEQWLDKQLDDGDDDATPSS
ncbi:hypothetical protein KNJ79_05185 [Sphingopyxis indica]|uniref:hypothetical protein n=1 Tax=Sphingopyxis indica TaxID=436663 RepID=UPI0029390B9C|nr:hypothetical protein [Sphingopyxis indica]WOF44326.1 hypothetical protein KNJ79_05185 [Sphingopyxis indica]